MNINNIQNLWQKKSYRNFPEEVLNFITADTSVCADARLCWIRLFTMAFYDKKWSIQISKKSLSRHLKKGVTSIHKYVKDLKAAGYIFTEQEEIGQALRIFVSIPEQLYNILNTCPDRKKSIEKCGTKIELETNNQVQDTPYTECGIGGYTECGIANNNINNNIYNNNIQKDIQVDSSSNERAVVVNFFTGEDESSKPIDNSEQKSKLAGDMTLLDTKIQDLYVEAQGLKQGDEILKLYTEIDKLTPKKHELERQLALLNRKKKPKADISNDLRLLTTKQLKKIKGCAIEVCDDYQLEAREFGVGMMKQVLHGSLKTNSRTTGELLSIPHRISIAKNLALLGEFDISMKVN